MARSYENFDRPYRRGLVLGLSLAELFLILLFLLLLIAFGINQVKDGKIDKLSDELADIYEAVGNEISPIDFTRLRNSEKERQRLSLENGKLKDDLSVAENKLIQLEKLENILKSSDLTADQAIELIKSKEGLPEAIATIEQQQAQIDQQQAQIDQQQVQIDQQKAQIDQFRIEVASKDAANEMLEYEIEKLEGENKKLGQGLADSNEQVRILSEAKGIDPPCWFRPRPEPTGAKKSRPIPVKIFDIQIRDNGLIVRPKDNSAYEHIDVDYGNDDAAVALSTLPQLPYNIRLSKGQFLSEFRWIREAGKQGKIQSYPCVFTVDLYDGTSAGNKSGYKRLKEGTVEALFNTFLPKDPW